MNVLRLPIFREVTAALLVAGLLLQSATAVAPGPAWWGSQSVADPDAFPDDFAAANVGQLKYLATKAAAALEAELPGGAGTAINAMIAAWNSPPASGVTRDDYLAVNQGQLKTVAALFYDRLGQPYPWAGSSAVRDDYQLVNLGQLKHVFAFELKFRGPGSLTQIPTATLAAALAQWQALPVKPAGSSTDDFDGDGIPNLQEYLMGSPLFDPLDIDGDRILDSVEDAHPGVLSKLRFADAVEDYDGDGVMNFEEVLLGLDLASATTSGRVDGLGDAEVLAWSLAAGSPLTPNTDAVRALWEVIDADWIDQEAGSYYLYWLLDTLVDGVPAGLSAFRADVATWAWQPWNPGVGLIESSPPPLAHDPNWEPVDLDGNGVADFDRDGDNLPDLWEYRYTLNPRDGQDANSDPDGDQLPSWQEYANGTNPRLADSDGDGFNDAVELWQGGDPVQQSIAPPLLLQVVGSSYQAIYTGQTTPALAVKVTQGGLPVAGVAVAFQLNEGGGRLKPASSAVGTPGSSLSQTTASNGIAAVTYESAEGEPEGTASISAGVAGAAVAQTFTVSIVAIPAAYGSAGGSDSTVGGSGGASGNPTRVPTPPRSTAMSAASIDAASADKYRIRVKRKSNSQSSYPAGAASLEYLPPFGLSPAALVGWGFDHSWADHTRLEFEALPPPPPSKQPVVPSGARRYLVLVYQGVEVESDTSAPKYAGVLTFQHKETGAREITLTGNIPDKFIKTDGSGSVTIEPPLATKAEERVWIRLDALYVMQPKLMANPADENPVNFIFEQVKTVRFCRWRYAFQPNGVGFDPKFISSDPDQVSLQIPRIAIDPANENPSVELKVRGIKGVNNAAETGPQTEDTGILTLTDYSLGYQAKSLIFVADPQDDTTFNGEPNDNGISPQDNAVDDLTRLAGFGATISIKFTPRGMDAPVELDIATMMQPLKQVKVTLNIVTRDGAASNPDQKKKIQKEFDTAKLIYRQVGYELVQQGDDVNDYPVSADIRNLIQDQRIIAPGVDAHFYVLDGRSKTPGNETTLQYLARVTKDTDSYQLFWFDINNYLGSGSGNSLGGESFQNGNFSLLVFDNNTGGQSAAHELGHCLGIDHPDITGFPNDLWLLMSHPGLNRQGDYKDQKRFHFTDPANLRPKH